MGDLGENPPVEDKFHRKSYDDIEVNENWDQFSPVVNTVEEIFDLEELVVEDSKAEEKLKVGLAEKLVEGLAEGLLDGMEHEMEAESKPRLCVTANRGPKSVGTVRHEPRAHSRPSVRMAEQVKLAEWIYKRAAPVIQDPTQQLCSPCERRDLLATHATGGPARCPVHDKRYQTLVGNVLYIPIPGSRDLNRSWRNFLSHDVMEWGFPYLKSSSERTRQHGPEAYLVHQLVPRRWKYPRNNV